MWIKRKRFWTDRYVHLCLWELRTLSQQELDVNFKLTEATSASGSLWDKLWYRHDDLHDGIHIAAVAKVMNAGESRAMERL